MLILTVLFLLVFLLTFSRGFKINELVGYGLIAWLIDWLSGNQEYFLTSLSLPDLLPPSTSSWWITGPLSCTCGSIILFSNKTKTDKKRGGQVYMCVGVDLGWCACFGTPASSEAFASLGCSLNPQSFESKRAMASTALAAKVKHEQSRKTHG